MSGKQDPLPWRVIALSGVLFVALAAAAWLLLGPDGASPPTTTGPPASGTEQAAPAEQGEQASPPTAQQTGATLDPSTPEGRAGLAAARAAAGTMDLQLFVIVTGVERLVPVQRTVAAPATLDAQVRRAVEELIAWQGMEATSPIAPEAGLRETWVSPGGIAYLDFDRAFYDFSGGGSLGELQAVYGLVATVAVSFPEIVAVQLLLEGDEMETLAGHVDLSGPLTPDTEWVLLERVEQQIQQSDDPA